MDFYRLKEYHMQKLKEALIRKEVDEPILDLLNLINSLDSYFTTSSCAGRITLMKIPKSGKKNEAEFLFKTHYETNAQIVWKKLNSIYEKYKEAIWFKQDPFIIHIAAKDINSAIKMLEIAHLSGLKHSGIISISSDRVMLEIQSTERVETIVAKNGKLLINEEYMAVLVEEANKKLRKTRERMHRFYENIKETFRV